MAKGKGLVTDKVEVKKGGKLPKSFGPGNHVAKILHIECRQPIWLKPGENPQYEIIMDLETAPIGGDFEGWFIDKNNEAKGKFLGQTGRVKSRQWPYKDGSWKNPKTGKEVIFDAVEDALVFIKMIEEECGTDFLVRTSGQFDTIEECVAGFNKEKPFKDVFFYWCIGGQAKMKDDGHFKYFMYLPKYETGFKLFAKEEDKSDVLPYDADRHVEKEDEPKSVGKFTPGDDDDDDNSVPWESAENADSAFDVGEEDDDEGMFDIEEDAF